MFNLPLSDKEYIYFSDPEEDYKGYMYVSLFSNGEIIGTIKALPSFRELEKIKVTKTIVFGDEVGRSPDPFNPDGPQRQLTEEQIESIENFINDPNSK
jgi:hypothetical protein